MSFEQIVLGAALDHHFSGMPIEVPELAGGAASFERLLEITDPELVPKPPFRAEVVPGAVIENDNPQMLYMEDLYNRDLPAMIREVDRAITALDGTEDAGTREELLILREELTSLRNKIGWRMGQDIPQWRRIELNQDFYERLREARLNAREELLHGGGQEKRGGITYHAAGGIFLGSEPGSGSKIEEPRKSGVLGFLQKLFR